MRGNQLKPQAQKTKTKIQQAFVTLVNAKGFTHLTVKALIEMANINRSTFYSHYLDKYDLLAKIETDIRTDLETLIKANLDDTMRFQKVDQGVETYPLIQKIIAYVAANFALFKALLGPNGDPSFEGQLKQLVTAFIDSNLNRRKGTTQLTTAIPQHYARELIVSQFFDIINIWLAEEQPTTPEEIATIVQKTRYLSPYEILAIED